MAERMPLSLRQGGNLPSEQGSTKAAEAVTRIAVAWLSNSRNKIPAAAVPELLRRIHEGLASL